MVSSVEHIPNSSASAAFPAHALDTFLPRLIRAGKRVAICDDVLQSQTQESVKKDSTEEPAAPAPKRLGRKPNAQKELNMEVAS